MSNAVLEQQRALDAHFEEQHDDDIEELHSRIIAIELDLKKAREELDELRQRTSERESRTNVVLEAYKSVLSDLTEVIETQRDDAAKREESVHLLLEAMEARLRNELQSPPPLLGATREDPPKRGRWPKRLFD